jgi:hypothetical protein
MGVGKYYHILYFLQNKLGNYDLCNAMQMK